MTRERRWRNFSASCLGELQDSMIITMRAMSEMQVARDEVIDMVTVRHGLMTAIGAVSMPGLMPIAAMVRCAVSGVGSRDVEPMFIDMIAMDVVQVPVVQIILMIPVANGLMAAVGAMLVTVPIMYGVIAHDRTPFMVGADGGPA
jgi:hypothetical protein